MNISGLPHNAIVFSNEMDWITKPCHSVDNPSNHTDHIIKTPLYDMNREVKPVETQAQQLPGVGGGGFGSQQLRARNFFLGW